MKTNQNFWQQSTKLGIFFAILFTICFAWFFIRVGSSEIQTLHNNLLALAFVGWSGMNLISFIIGLVQSFIWGYIAVGLWYLSSCCSQK